MICLMRYRTKAGLIKHSGTGEPLARSAMLDQAYAPAKMLLSLLERRLAARANAQDFQAESYPNYQRPP